jgi:hypothetical protein
MGLFLLSLLAAGVGQEPEPPRASGPPAFPQSRITVSLPAMPAGRLVPLIATRTGLKLECDRDLAPDVLLLAVSDRPISEALQKLAYADHAVWTPVGQAWRLSRPAALASRLGREDLEAREAGLRTHLAPIFESLSFSLTRARAVDAVRKRILLRRRNESDSDEPFDEKKWFAQELNRRKVDSLNPPFRLIARCIKEIGLTRIVSLETGERVVYSTNPNRVQKALGRPTKAAVAAFFAEEEVWRQAKREHGIAKKEGDEEDQDDWAMRFGDHCFLRREGAHRPDWLPKPGSPDRVVIAVTGGWYGGYSIDLKILDAQGGGIVGFESDELIRTSEGGSSPETGKQDRSAPVSLSKLTRQLTREYGATRERVLLPNPPAIDRGFAESLANPMEHEPLDLWPADGYRSAAKSKGLSLAAYLSDQSFDGIPNLNRESPLTVNQFLAEQGETAEAALSDGWLTVRSKRPIEDRKNRIDRKALTVFLKSILATGKISLDAEATMAASIREGAYQSIVSVPEWVLARGKHSGSGGNIELFRLYGCLTDAQRKRLHEGGQVSYGELNGKQRPFAIRAVYGPHSNMYGGGTRPPQGVADPGYEPTELSPDGLDPTSGIRARRTAEQWVYLIDPSKTGIARHFDMVLPPDPRSGFNRLPRSAPQGGIESLLCEVRTVNKLHLEGDLCSWRWISWDYHDEPEPVPGDPVPISRLPADLRTRVENAMKAYDRDQPQPFR